MSAFLLKIVSISSKGFKKQLLLTTPEVATLAHFLKNKLQTEVMVINTNLALDVYYHSSVAHDVLIKNKFLLMMAQQQKFETDFHFNYFNSVTGIKEETQVLFRRLVEMPLFFKSYCKSLLHQVNLNYEINRPILRDLFSIWQSVLLGLQADEVHSIKFNAFLSQLQKSYITHQCHPDLKLLLEEALAPLHVN